MKSLTVNIVIALLLLMHANHTNAQVKAQLTVTLSKPGNAFILNFQLQQGSIEINSYSGSTIQVEATLIAEKNINQNKNQNINTNVNNGNSVEAIIAPDKSFDRNYISATEVANTVTLTPVTPKQKLAVVIKVPKNKGTFHLSSMLHAPITANDLTGELDISSNAGEIVLKNISGSAVVSNVAGGITASFSSITENTPMAFSTVAGKLDISFPSTLKANVKVTSDNGELYSDFELRPTSSTSPPKIDKTSGGQYHVQVGAVSAQIGGGGVDMRFKNMVGNIYIRKNK